MNSFNIFNTILLCVFGSSGILIWFLNRYAKKKDDKSHIKKELIDVKDTLSEIKTGLIMALENDKVIFKALRNNEINGESDTQDKKMDDYFLSLLKENLND